MLATANSSVLTVEHNPARFNLAQSLFLISVVLAPLELKLAGSFTVYDVLVMGIGLLLMSTEAKELKFPPFEFMAAVYVFLLFALLSAFRATFPLESLTQVLQFTFIFFIQIPVILTVVRSQSMLRWSLLSLLVGSLIMTGWAMYFQEEGFHHRMRTFASENSNRLGYPTSYLSPFLLCFLIDGWRRRHFLMIVFTLCALYTLLWGLTASGSRSATVGTLAALMIFFTFRHGLQINLALLMRAFFTIAMLVIISYLFYSSDFFPGILRERIDKTLMFQSSLVNDRTRLAIAGWRGFMQSPWLGVGFDNFRHVATQFNVPMVSNQTPHNIWLQFLAQIGIFGTLAFMFMIGFWFLRLLQCQRMIVDPSQRTILWALIASMCAIMTIFMFIPIMIHRHYWLIYGLGLAAVFSVKNIQLIAVPNSSEPSKPDD
ncbi:MAG: O-antigen ligase family protein [Methylobacter sp.]